MWTFSLWAMVLREGEGGSGGGGAPGGAAAAAAPGTAPASAAPGGAGAGGSGAGAASAPGGAPADPYWRDFLPANLKADKPEERFGRLADAWKEQRDRDAARPVPPKTAAEYPFEPSEKAKPYFQAEKDPMLDLAREAALKAGLPKEAFGGFVNTLYEAAVDKGLLAPPYDPIAEGKRIAERVAPGKPWEQAKPEVARLVADMESFAGVLGDRLKLSDGGKALLKTFADEAGGVEVLQALSGVLGRDPAFGAGGGSAGSGGWTKESLDKAVADPRYQLDSPQYDKAYREQVEAGFRSLYGSTVHG